MLSLWEYMGVYSPAACTKFFIIPESHEVLRWNSDGENKTLSRAILFRILKRLTICSG